MMELSLLKVILVLICVPILLGDLAVSKYAVSLSLAQKHIKFGNDVHLRCSAAMVAGKQIPKGLTWQFHLGSQKVASNGDVKQNLSQKYKVSIGEYESILTITKFSVDDLKHTMKCSYGAEEKSYMFVLKESVYTYLPHSNDVNITYEQHTVEDGYISITIRLYFGKVYPVPYCWISIKDKSIGFTVHKPFHKNKLFETTFEHQLLSKDCEEKIEIICDIGIEKLYKIDNETTVNCTDSRIFYHSQADYGVTVVISCFAALLLLILLAFLIFFGKENIEKYRKKKKISANFLFQVFYMTLGSSFLFGYNLSVFNLPGQISGLTTDQWALLVSSFALSGILGSILTFIIIKIQERNDWNSSKVRGSTILAANIIGFVASVFPFPLTEENRFTLLVIHRCIMGLSNGLSLNATRQFLKVRAPDTMKNSVSSLYQLSIALGILFGNILSLENVLGSPEHFRWLFGLTIFPSIISIVGLTFHDDGNHNPDDNLEVNKKYTSKPCVACLLHFCQQICGINIIICYSSSIFTMLGVGITQKEVAVSGTSLINFMITAIAVFTVNKFARKTMLILPLVIMSLAFGGLPLILHYAKPVTRGVYAAAGTIALNLYVIGFAFSLGPLPYIMIEDKKFQIATTFNWIGNFAVLILFPYLQSSAFYCFAALVFISMVLLCKCLPEIKEDDELGNNKRNEGEANENIVETTNMIEYD